MYKKMSIKDIHCNECKISNMQNNKWKQNVLSSADSDYHKKLIKTR